MNRFVAPFTNPKEATTLANSDILVDDNHCRKGNKKAEENEAVDEDREEEEGEDENDEETRPDDEEEDEDAYLSMEDDQEEYEDISKQHRLQYKYSLWYSRRPTRSNFDQSLKLLTNFETVEQFWSIYSYFSKPNVLPMFSDVHLFKCGIKPMWEDEANREGGRWVIRVRKGVGSRLWENLILAILGEQFMMGEEICGAVISTRVAEDVISVWNRTAHPSIISHIRDTLRRILNLPATTLMDYKVHIESLKDRDLPVPAQPDRI